MASRTQRRPRLVASEDSASPETASRTRGFVNQVELAYERIEQMLVNCQLKPGRFMAMQDLQELVHFGRTPVLQAVSRLAADTLVIVRPRHGVQIAPIDLARERGLLPLRRDTERFVIRLAAERSGRREEPQVVAQGAEGGGDPAKTKGGKPKAPKPTDKPSPGGTVEPIITP